MPSADNAIEDFGSLLLQGMRKQQRQNKVEAEKALLAESAAEFHSGYFQDLQAQIGSGSLQVRNRIWLFMLLGTGRLYQGNGRFLQDGEWLHLFGFGGAGGGVAAETLEVGFEVLGDRVAMLNASRLLLIDVNAFAANPPETTRWIGSTQPRLKPRKMPELAWPTVLPPLIEFLFWLAGCDGQRFPAITGNVFPA